MDIKSKMILLQIKNDIKNKLINKNDKINPWVSRPKWIEKNDLDSLIDRIEKFVPNNNYSIRDKIKLILLHDGVVTKCKICGKPTNYHATIQKFALFCSKKCGDKSVGKADKARKNINPKLLRKKFFEKYNTHNVYEISEIKDKIQKTNLEKYGFINPTKNKEIRKKISESTKKIIRKDRKNHPAYRNLNKEQIFLLNNLDILNKEHIENKIPITTLSLKYGFSNSTLSHVFKRNGIPITIFYGSEPERLIQKALNKNNIKFISNTRSIINPKEIDIFLPEYNLGIEINGLYWHSDDRKHKNHLKEKQELCKGKGIKLIHFFDTEIINNLDICVSIIMNLIHKTSKIIYGRKTILKDISSLEYNSFCSDNHIQGARNASIRYGLFFEDELVSIMSFNKNGEMVRFCNKKFTSVVGGASKLFKRILKNHDFPRIYTFSDKRIFDGGLYENLGFTRIHDTYPNYFYFNKKEYVLRSRLQFQKYKLENKLENFDKKLSEIENMRNNDWLRIYDCGNTLWEFE